MLLCYQLFHQPSLPNNNKFEMATTSNDSFKAPQTTNPDYINLKVKSQEGEEIYFKIKKTTSFKKLMDTYCSRGNLSAGNVRFLFDGNRLTENQTPKDLNMENGDEIDVMTEQLGG